MIAAPLVVSLHDVAPPFEDSVRRYLEALATAGVSRCVLKVVPNWHGAHRLDHSPGFAAFLRDRAEHGDEIVLHGIEHRVRGRLRGPVAGRVRARLFAPGVAECLTLGPDALSAELRDALDILSSCGLPAPEVFCAPGWLSTSDLLPVFHRHGITHVTGMMSVLDVSTRRRTVLPGFGTMGAGRGQEWGIDVLNRLVRTALRERQPVKAYLHPQLPVEDPSARRVLAAVSNLIAAGRTPSTFAQVAGNG